jgi:hypothetical protein
MLFLAFVIIKFVVSATFMVLVFQLRLSIPILPKSTRR